MAIPYNLVYKVITGNTPFTSTPAPKKPGDGKLPEAGTPVDDVNVSRGVVTVISGLWISITDLTITGKMRSQPDWVKRTVTYVPLSFLLKLSWDQHNYQWTQHHSEYVTSWSRRLPCNFWRQRRTYNAQFQKITILLIWIGEHCLLGSLLGNTTSTQRCICRCNWWSPGPCWRSTWSCIFGSIRWRPSYWSILPNNSNKDRKRIYLRFLSNRLMFFNISGMIKLKHL